jgi:uncharacterized protein YqeY
MTEYGWNQDMETGLLDKLRADLKSAMLGKDNAARDTIRQVISELPKLTIPITLESGKKTTRCKNNDEITNDDVIAIIRGLVKSEKTVLEFKQETSSPYLDLLSRYLPQMLDGDAIRAWIGENVDFAKFKSPMQAMGQVMKHFGKTADGALVKSILAELAAKAG